MVDEFLDFPFRDNGVKEVHPSILPLDRAVDVQCIAQPIVRRTSRYNKQGGKYFLIGGGGGLIFSKGGNAPSPHLPPEYC